LDYLEHSLALLVVWHGAEGTVTLVVTLVDVEGAYGPKGSSGRGTTYDI
jgi:hypothetical protein